MWGQGLAKVEAAIAFTSLEAFGPLLKAQVSTLVQPSPASSMVSVTLAALT